MTAGMPSMLPRSGGNWDGSPGLHSRRPLAETVDWYLGNREWIDFVRSGEYLTWMEKELP